MRFGYPAINIEMELFAIDPIEFWHGLAIGEIPRHVHKFDEVALGICYVLPPFPNPHAVTSETIGVPLYLDGDFDEHIHPCEMAAGSAPHMVDGKVTDRPCLVSAGTYCLVVSGCAYSIGSARAVVRRSLDRISMPRSPFYREDIGRRLAKQLPALQRHGYAAGMAYR